MEDGKKRGKRKGRVAQQMEKNAARRKLEELPPPPPEEATDPPPKLPETVGGELGAHKAVAWKWTMDGRLVVQLEMMDAEPVEFKPGKYDEDQPALLYIGLSRLQDIALVLGSAKVSFSSGRADYEKCFDQVSRLNDGVRETEDKTMKVAEKFCEMMEPEGLAQLFGEDMEALVTVTMEGLGRMM